MWEGVNECGVGGKLQGVEQRRGRRGRRSRRSRRAITDWPRLGRVRRRGVREVGRKEDNARRAADREQVAHERTLDGSAKH